MKHCPRRPSTDYFNHSRLSSRLSRCIKMLIKPMKNHRTADLPITSTTKNASKTNEKLPTATQYRLLQSFEPHQPPLEMHKNVCKTNEKTTFGAYVHPGTFPRTPGGTSCAPCTPNLPQMTSATTTKSLKKTLVLQCIW